MEARTDTATRADPVDEQRGRAATRKDLAANVYNTWGLNGSDTTRDSSPPPLLDKIDVKEMAKQFGMLAVFKNGPRLWTLDWIEVEMGKEVDFGGMKARWVNWLDLRGISTEPGAADYKNITITRHTRFGFNKGTRVSLLDDPQGNTWCMKSFKRTRSVAEQGRRLSLRDRACRAMPERAWGCHAPPGSRSEPWRRSWQVPR